MMEKCLFWLQAAWIPKLTKNKTLLTAHERITVHTFMDISETELHHMFRELFPACASPQELDL